MSIPQREAGYRDNPRPALHPDEDYARHILQPALVPGEIVLWANRPERGVRLERNPHAFTQIVWTLFSLIWVCCGFITDGSLAMGLLGVPFVLMGLHGLIGHYLYDAWRRRRLVYGITNRRLLVMTPGRVLAAPWLGELRTHLVRERHIRVVAPRLELRAVPDAAEVHRLLVEAQASAPESGI